MPKKLVLFFVNTKYEIRNTKQFVTISLALYTLYLILTTPSHVFAQGLTREECFKDTIAKLGCLPFYLSNIINGFFALSAIATIVLIILSGIRLLTSGGDAGRVAKAKTSLFYSIVGFVIVLSSFLILRVISFITGAECINALGVNTCN
jgi:hypothetical protein